MLAVTVVACGATLLATPTSWAAEAKRVAARGQVPRWGLNDEGQTDVPPGLG